jgi:pantoate--beta-alanine ligase
MECGLVLSVFIRVIRGGSLIFYHSDPPSAITESAMLEIEQKYADIDPADLRSRLARLGAGPEAVHVEEDHYFNAADRDFARTGEAFRLRRVGEKNFFTYKGPKQAAALKVRLEREIALPDGDEAAAQHAEVLKLLGFRAVAVVRKRRASFALEREGVNVTVCIDEVDELGTFAEVEALAEHAEHAAAVVTRLAGELGLARVEPRSYLGLLLARRARTTSREPAVVTTAGDLRAAIAEARRQRLSVGFVPTMGALHEGHRSLIEAARGNCDFVAVSIFVNPTQFGPHEDLSRYPRPFADDVALCRGAGVDLIFHPAPEVIYPAGYPTFVEVTGPQDEWEGASRPGHFRGVATVVLKLLNLVQPDRAYFGQKDAQQVRVVRQLVRDLDVPVDVVVCPTVREPDGLALSSRNRYLDPQQRTRAAGVYQALKKAEERFARGETDPEALRRVMADHIASIPGAALDYAAVVSGETFAVPETVRPGAILALAVRFGQTRLIDNLVLS